MELDYHSTIHYTQVIPQQISQPKHYITSLHFTSNNFTQTKVEKIQIPKEL